MQKSTINTFPNELLSKVFIEAAAENPKTSCLSRQLVPKKHNSGYIFVRPALWLRSRTNVALSHVCRLFRTIAIDTPELWVNVSNLQTKEELDVYLQRSKQVGLGIHLLIDDPKYNFKDFDANVRAVAVPRDFMNAVLPLAHRWVGFEFKTGKWIHFFTDSVPKDLSALCKGLKLPRLRSLSLSYPSPRYFDEGLGLTELEQSEKGVDKGFPLLRDLVHARSQAPEHDLAHSEGHAWYDIASVSQRQLGERDVSSYLGRSSSDDAPAPLYFTCSAYRCV